jgi:hypothetical protein
MNAPVNRSAFREFSWLNGDLQRDHAAIFAAQMKDLGFGVQKCLQLIEASELDRAHGAEDDDEDNAPLLNAYDTGVLLRFAITASEIIGAQADEFLVRAQKRSAEVQS